MRKLKKLKKIFGKLSDAEKRIVAEMIKEWEQDNRISLMLDEFLPEIYDQVTRPTLLSCLLG